MCTLHDILISCSLSIEPIILYYIALPHLFICIFKSLFSCSPDTFIFLFSHCSLFAPYLNYPSCLSLTSHLFCTLPCSPSPLYIFLSPSFPSYIFYLFVPSSRSFSLFAPGCYRLGRLRFAVCVPLTPSALSSH